MRGAYGSAARALVNHQRLYEYRFRGVDQKQRDDVRAALAPMLHAVEPSPQPRPGDIPVYLSHCARLHSPTDWRPRHGPRAILADVHRWISAHEAATRASL